MIDKGVTLINSMSLFDWTMFLLGFCLMAWLFAEDL